MYEHAAELEEFSIFRDREDAGERLAELFKGRKLIRPLVLAIPRGGLPVGQVLAKKIEAELDVILVRKLRAPSYPELALGAISEGGKFYLDKEVLAGFDAEEVELHLEDEKKYQLNEIARRQKLFRNIKPQALVKGRSVIVVDDGVATGSTMIAALQLIRAEGPMELIAASPVGSPYRLSIIKNFCDEVVCVHSSDDLRSVGQFYEDFSQVEDREVVEVLADASLDQMKRIKKLNVE